MAIEAERLIISLEANINQFTRETQKAQKLAEQRMSSIEKRFQAATKNISGSFKGVGAGIVKGFGALAVADIAIDAVRDAAKIATAYVDLQNALKVTGLEGDALNRVLADLTKISLKQGAPLEALVGLYSKASQSAKELGASQGDLLEFSDGIATALRLQGGSAAQASGALLQLSQALGSGKIAAEEFNSINEGARPILQAVANGLKEAGGSVSKLKALVNDGKLSSEAFFKAALAGFPSIAEQADKADGTVSQALSRVSTAMLTLIGKMNESTGASKSAAEGLNNVAEVIQKLPDYINAASKGLSELIDYIDKLDRDSFLGQTLSFLGNSASAPGLSTVPNGPRFPNLVPGGQANDRVSSAFETTAGTGVPDGIAAAGKSGRDLADSANRAKVSIKDLGVAADKAAKSDFSQEVESVTGGSVGSFVDNVVGAESGGNRNAKNPNSSATGLGQFIDSTWISLFRKNFPEIASTKADGDILKLRTDANYSRKLIEAYAKDNSEILTKAGVSVNEAALHLAHFLGPGDAAKVLSAAPGTKLSGLISQASINANASILGGGKTVDDARAYAERRAGNTRRAAGNLTPAEETAQDRVESYQDLVAGSVEYISNLKSEQEALGRTSYQASLLAHEQDLLNQASQSGLEITPQLRDQIKELAAGMATADESLRAFGERQAMTIDQLDAFRDGARDVLGGFISDLRDGKSASEALGNALASIADKLLQSGLDSLIDNIFGKQGTAGTGLLGGIGKLFGFASGGYTGAGGRNQPAGIVHKGEYVVPKHIVDQIGVRNVERMMSRGYVDGGLVAPLSMRPPDAARLVGSRKNFDRTHITVGVDVDKSGNLMPFVSSVADQRAQVRVSQGQDQARRALPAQQSDRERRYG